MALSLGLFVCLAVGADPAPPLQAGFRRFTLTYRPEKEEPARERPGFLWYPTKAAEERFDYRGQIGAVAKDAEPAPGRHPVIVFSHGFLGGADQVLFLTEELARHGYIVAAVDHADANRAKRTQPLPVPNFADAKSWNDTKFRDRRDDLAALLDLVLAWDGDGQQPLHQRVQRSAIGAAGHSLGGYSVFGWAGAWPAWKDERIKAVCLYSPYTMPFITQGQPANVALPVMFQGGTWDWAITPFLAPVYERLSSPKYSLVLKRETHFGWTNLVSVGKTTAECVRQGNPKLIAEFSVAFFDRHLRNAPAPRLEQRDESLASFASETRKPQDPKAE